MPVLLVLWCTFSTELHSRHCPTPAVSAQDAGCFVKRNAARSGWNTLMLAPATVPHAFGDVHRFEIPPLKPVFAIAVQGVCCCASRLPREVPCLSLSNSCPQYHACFECASSFRLPTSCSRHSLCRDTEPRALPDSSLRRLAQFARLQELLGAKLYSDRRGCAHACGGIEQKGFIFVLS